MEYFTRHITNIHLVDVFSPRERLQTDYQVTTNLANFLQRDNSFETQVYYPATKEELMDVLSSIKESTTSDAGVILHLLGHADSGAYGFGNGTFFIPWKEIKEILVQINAACNDGLIVNTTCICYGNSIFKLAKGKTRPFFAAVGSTTPNTLQAWMHNKSVYQKCSKNDHAARWWSAQNDMLSYEGGRRYEIMPPSYKSTTSPLTQKILLFLTCLWNSLMRPRARTRR